MSEQNIYLFHQFSMKIKGKIKLKAKFHYKIMFIISLIFMKAVNYFLKSFILDVRQGFEYVFYRDVLWQVFFCELCKCFRTSFSKNINAELSLTLLRLGFLKVLFWGAQFGTPPTLHISRRTNPILITWYGCYTTTLE